MLMTVLALVMARPKTAYKSPSPLEPVISTYGYVVVAFARLVAFVCDIKEIVHCNLSRASPPTLRLQRLGEISIHR